MEFRFNQNELMALYGLPHIQRLVYIQALRPYMDYRTGIVGIQRKISYQSIREELYVEPHVGYKSLTLSRDQIKRALKGLERVGLIELHSLEKQLILKCVYASADNSVQNKAAPKPPYQAAPVNHSKTPMNSNYNRVISQEAAMAALPQAATPPVSVMYVCMSQMFEQFWQAYPEKRSQQAALQIFNDLNFSEDEFSDVLAKLKRQVQFYQDEKRKGHWVPRWKYPANWLRDRCWNDELAPYVREKKNERSNDKNASGKGGVDLLWDSCQSDVESNGSPESAESAEARHASTRANVIDFIKTK